MSLPNMNFAVVLLNNAIEKEPGFIIGPITKFLGVILDAIFNVVYLITEPHSLGLAIILFTIVTRLLMMPLAFNQQKSMQKMQKIQPEMDKIRKKYEKDKTPEGQQKMNAELQAFMSKNGVNQFAGCLPIFIQFPIFFALMYLMRQTYLFISRLGGIYEQLALKVMEAPGYIDALKAASANIMKNTDAKILIDLNNVADVQRVLNKFTSVNWYGGVIKESTGFLQSAERSVTGVLQSLPADSVRGIEEILMQKQNIEQFLGINLVENAGLAFPGILIPILCAGTTFLSTYLMGKQSRGNDQMAQMQQSMLIVMPIMMGVMTITISSGVGIYWITGSVFQIFQQYIMNRHFRKDEVAK